MDSLPCIGGPLDGQEWASRCPKGILLVNRPAGEVVIYDRAQYEGETPYDVWFLRRNALGQSRLPEINDKSAEKNRYRAALEPNYDVLAYDPEVMGPWGQ